MRRITYYALKDMQVGDDFRKAGDLVPEAADWPFIHMYVQNGQVAPVLVATLPQKVQETLEKWEKDQEVKSAPEGSGSTLPTTGVVEATPSKKEQVA